MTTANSTAGSKRPNDAEEKAPRKKNQNGIDDDMIEEAFQMDEMEEMEDEQMLLEVEEEELGEAGRNWMRPEPNAIDPKKDKLVFQQLELDYTSGPANAEFYADASKHGLQEVPVLRMFGVNEHGMPSSSKFKACLLFADHKFCN